ncbi:hypothetical protein [Hufsiella ginkgonis]|uniref:Uncharacterized protein n=1 Tax=Hufsiella ginkgonis TaxID=2695274 RepID=A0A7K1Y0G1_9SPHI|nr:hypothetical protein [Hufsiella ginkgonis]MXV16764.1 hypothetical protein [Hufsiella ginkgonis]
MNILIKTLAIITGYAIFVVSSLALFQLSGQKPHDPATGGFRVLTAFYGAFFSIVSGLVLQLIARTKTLTLNIVLAVIIAGFATFSLLKAGGSHWTQWMAILIFAPVSIVGGLFLIWRRSAAR